MPAYSGLWNGVYAQDYSALSPAIELGNPLNEFAEAYTPRIYARGALGKLIEKLAGVAPGATATKQHKRVRARVVFGDDSQGGAVPIDTFDDINRATTAADVTAITRAFTYKSQPTYPADLSGNGGGSKLGF